ncbi:hypothetical protein T4E_7194 [Trichinella pseudospiralis]|uniref:Uncharacterized protein n=1 Tax=Trichinella pseudospiralis TaxID=6337 RepID=A0A0V0Y9G2_TRIPS|nr:hypothetical protein T4E_7194 [Trichinella pseudospiralis]
MKIFLNLHHSTEDGINDKEYHRDTELEKYYERDEELRPYLTIVKTVQRNAQFGDLFTLKCVNKHTCRHTETNTAKVSPETKG